MKLKSTFILLSATALTACGNAPSSSLNSSSNAEESSAANPITSFVPYVADPVRDLGALSANNAKLRLAGTATAYFLGEEGVYFDYDSESVEDSGLIKIPNEGYYAISSSKSGLTLGQLATPATSNVLYQYLVGGPDIFAAYKDASIFVKKANRNGIYHVTDASFLKTTSTMFGLDKLLKDGTFRYVDLIFSKNAIQFQNMTIGVELNATFSTIGSTTYEAFDAFKSSYTPAVARNSWTTQERQDMRLKNYGVMPFIPGLSYAATLTYLSGEKKFRVNDYAMAYDPSSAYEKVLTSSDNNYVKDESVASVSRYLKPIKAQDEQKHIGAKSWCIDFLFTPEDKIVGEDEEDTARKKALYPHGIFAADFYIYEAPYMAASLEEANEYLLSLFQYREGDSALPAIVASNVAKSISIKDLKKEGGVYSFATGVHNAFMVTLLFEDASKIEEDVAVYESALLKASFIKESEHSFYLLDTDFPSDLSVDTSFDLKAKTMTFTFLD